jgi:hypothetical protein
VPTDIQHPIVDIQVVRIEPVRHDSEHDDEGERQFVKNGLCFCMTGSPLQTVEQVMRQAGERHQNPKQNVNAASIDGTQCGRAGAGDGGRIGGGENKKKKEH